MKFYLKQSNGEISEVNIENGETLNLQGEYLFVTGTSDYSATMINGDADLKVFLVDRETGETISIYLEDFVNQVQQNDWEDPFSLTTALGVSKTGAGDAEIEETINSGLQPGEIIDQLEQLLSNNDSDEIDGFIIDDFGSLADFLESSAAGEQIQQNSPFFFEEERDQDLSPAEEENTRPISPRDFLDEDPDEPENTEDTVEDTPEDTPESTVAPQTGFVTTSTSENTVDERTTDAVPENTTPATDESTTAETDEVTVDENTNDGTDETTTSEVAETTTDENTVMDNPSMNLSVDEGHITTSIEGFLSVNITGEDGGKYARVQEINDAGDGSTDFTLGFDEDGTKLRLFNNENNEQVTIDVTDQIASGDPLEIGYEITPTGATLTVGDETSTVNWSSEINLPENITSAVDTGEKYKLDGFVDSAQITSRTEESTDFTDYLMDDTEYEFVGESLSDVLTNDEIQSRSVSNPQETTFTPDTSTMNSLLDVFDTPDNGDFI